MIFDISIDRIVSSIVKEVRGEADPTGPKETALLDWDRADPGDEKGASVGTEEAEALRRESKEEDAVAGGGVASISSVTIRGEMLLVKRLNNDSIGGNGSDRGVVDVSSLLWWLLSVTEGVESFKKLEDFSIEGADEKARTSHNDRLGM